MEQVTQGGHITGHSSIDNKYYNAHGGVFLLLMFCAVWKPAVEWQGAKIALVVATLLILSLALLHKIYRGPGFVSIWRDYKWEFSLCCGYVTVSLFSLLVNLSYYQSLGDFIFYGVSPIAIWCAMPMALLYFVLPVSNKSLARRWYNGEWIVWAVMVLMAVFAIWQAINFIQAWVVTQHFVASDIPQRNHVITSVMRTNTDFGPVMGFSTICILSILLYSRFNKRYMPLAYALVAGIVTAAGVLSASKNFVITFIVGGLFIWLIFFKRKPKMALFSAALLFIAAHVVVLSHPHTTARFLPVMPYIGKLSKGEPLVLEDFKPRVGLSSLIERKKLWDRAFDMWRTSPVIGVSAGAFKLGGEGDNPVHATHNLFVQVLVEAGVVGLVIILALLLILMRRRLKYWQAALFIAVILNLQFDYYLDHSLPWILATAWMLARTRHIALKSEVARDRNNLIQTHSQTT